MSLATAGSLELTRHDQLAAERRRRAVFAGFAEAPINFPPTYRMIKGAAEYSNKKNQNPSYCDRVLHRAAPGHAAARALQLSYEPERGLSLAARARARPG